MKKYTYYVKGIETDLDAERIKAAAERIIPEAQDVSVSAQTSSLSFSVRLCKRELDKRELMLLGAVSSLDMELILPSNTVCYTYVGDKRRTNGRRLRLRVALAAAAVIICALFVFAACRYYAYGKDDPDSSQENKAPQITISDELDLPDYMRRLINLDELFKYYSYDGIDEEAMTEAILKAYIAATGDVYAEYMTAQELEDYLSDRAGDFVGIGVSIANSEITVNGYTYKALEVVSVFKDSPALESGVKVGDCIVYVGGGDDKILVDTLGYTAALDLMLGDAGTVAQFTVFRPTSKGEIKDYEQIEFSVTRKKVTTQSVTYRMSEADSSVGIVHISGFDGTTPRQFTEAVDTLKASGCEYFVFDVRNNPGGALDSIEAVLSYFLNEGDLIVSTEYSNGDTDADYVRVKHYASPYEYYDVAKKDIGKYKDLKCIVITNENTASAAELFTATLRDYGIADVVGSTTYGKGCMQSILTLNEDSGLVGGLKLTVAMYFSKSHTNYHGIGIVPDFEVELDDEASQYNFFLLPEAKDNQLQRALEELLK